MCSSRRWQVFALSRLRQRQARRPECEVETKARGDRVSWAARRLRDNSILHGLASWGKLGGTDCQSHGESGAATMFGVHWPDASATRPWTECLHAPSRWTPGKSDSAPSPGLRSARGVFSRSAMRSSRQSGAVERSAGARELILDRLNQPAGHGPLCRVRNSVTIRDEPQTLFGGPAPPSTVERRLRVAEPVATAGGARGAVVLKELDGPLAAGTRHLEDRVPSPIPAVVSRTSHGSPRP